MTKKVRMRPVVLCWRCKAWVDLRTARELTVEGARRIVRRWLCRGCLN